MAYEADTLAKLHKSAGCDKGEKYLKTAWGKRQQESLNCQDRLAIAILSEMRLTGVPEQGQMANPGQEVFGHLGIYVVRDVPFAE